MLNAEMKSAVDDIVTPYNLPYQVKDALKNYVPSLNDAKELSDGHPTRMVNRAARFDHTEDRTHSYMWEVPQPGHGPNVWIPLRINPEQEQLWADLLDGNVSPGQLQLIQNRTSWTLHVAVEYSVEDPDYDIDSDDVTHIDLDIGESSLITGCAL